MTTPWQQSNQLYRRYARNLALIYQKRQDVKMFTELLLTLSVTVLFALFAIRPTIITIVELNKDIESKDVINQKLDSKIQALNQADVLYGNNITTIEIIDQAIPEDPYPAVYSRQIEGIAKKHNVKIMGMGTEDVPLVATPETPDEVPLELVPVVTDSFPPEAKSFDFRINLSGDYQNVVSFLSDLENLRYPIFEDSISIQISDGQSTGNIIVAISGRLAYLP